MEYQYLPKGSMCMVCVHVLRKCSHLPFSTYPKMGKPDDEGLIEVKCGEFEKKENTMKTVKVTKTELIHVLTANLEKHKKDLDAMTNKYRKDTMEELKQLIEDFRINVAPMDVLNIQWPRFPPKPRPHIDDYKTALKMLDMSVEEVIELTETEFTQLVMDQWTWKHEFEMTKTAYGL